MQKNIMTKSFEQLQTTVLPKKIDSIITNLAREVRKSHKGHALQPKHIEASYAKLHMRMYQSYGPLTEEVMREAYTELQRQLSGDRPTLESKSLRKTVLGFGRFF